MYCKNCGEQIPDDSKFCKYCGYSLKEDNSNKEPIRVQVEANVSSTQKKEKFRLSSAVKGWLLVYAIWFVIHVLLLISGGAQSPFFPNIYKSPDYDELFYKNLNEYGFAIVPRTNHWNIDWNISYYGLKEFIVYVFLFPLIIYACYKVYKVIKSIHLNKKHAKGL